MPKEEKKKPASNVANAISKKFNVGQGPAAGGSGDQKNNLMAELKMKQQAAQPK